MSELLTWLQRAGPTRGGSLRDRMGLPQSTLQRRLAALREHLLVTGKARATTYAARRSVDGLHTPVRVHEVRPDGTVRHALSLHPVHPLGVWVESHCDDVVSAFHCTDPREPRPDPAVDLPWFLTDLKPVGYLGRSWARVHPDLRFAADPARWDGDDVLRYAALHSIDGPGAWLVGPVARQRFEDGEESRPRVRRGSEARVFPELIRQSLEGWRGTSTPGGEQPKFTVTLEGRSGAAPCLVKFSPPRDSRAGARWADLLLVEHLVHGLLTERGLPAMRSRILDADGRRYLIAERFDRTPAGGRVGLCSLAALDEQGVASDLRSWSVATRHVLEQGRIPLRSHARTCWLEAFGHGIANTDMHAGNLSFRLRGARITGLAPVYDMLPMAHAPVRGEVVDRVYEPHAHHDDWPHASRASAVALWDRVIAEPRISEDYRRLADRQRDAVRQP